MLQRLLPAVILLVACGGSRAGRDGGVDGQVPDSGEVSDAGDSGPDGAMTYELCNGIDDDRDGVIDEGDDFALCPVRPDLLHARCTGGRCVIVECPFGTGDCDDDYDTGCEEDLTTDAECGACGSPCAAPTHCLAATCGEGGPAVWDGTFGAAEADRALAVAVDSDGNAYVAGTFRDTVDLGGGPRAAAGDEDAFVLSVDPDGAYRWDRTYGSPGREAALSIAVDGLDRVVAVGRFEQTVAFGSEMRTSAGTTDIFVVSLTAGGDLRWVRTFGAEYSDTARAVTTDPDGNIALAGRVTAFADRTVDFGGGARTGDFYVLSLDADGGYRWDRIWAAGSNASGQGIAADADGNVVAVGTYDDIVDFGGGERHSVAFDDVVVLSLDVDGGYRWDRTAGGVSFDVARGVAVDGAGNAYVTGVFGADVDFGLGPRTAAGGEEWFVWSIGPDGSPRWDRPLGGPGPDEGRAVAADAAGNTFVAGASGRMADLGGGARECMGMRDAAVVSLAPDGSPRWDRVLPITGDTDRARGVALDGRFPVVVGSFEGSGTLSGPLRTSAGADDAFFLRLRD